MPTVYRGGMITDSDSDVTPTPWTTTALTMAHDFRTTMRIAFPVGDLILHLAKVFSTRSARICITCSDGIVPYDNPVEQCESEVLTLFKVGLPC